MEIFSVLKSENFSPQLKSTKLLFGVDACQITVGASWMVKKGISVVHVTLKIKLMWGKPYEWTYRFHPANHYDDYVTTAVQVPLRSRTFCALSQARTVATHEGFVTKVASEHIERFHGGAWQTLRSEDNKTLAWFSCNRGVWKVNISTIGR